jgi:mono/diheme cytochrome c family protein
MKLFKLTLVAVALLSFAFACSSSQNSQPVDTRPTSTPSTAKATPAPTATPDELAIAAADFSNFCARCHKADGTGGPFKIEEENKTIEVPSLREHGKKDPDEHLAKHIREGGKEMPPFGKRLDDTRINNLVRYIRREFHGQTASAAGSTSTGNTSATPAH